MSPSQPLRRINWPSLLIPLGFQLAVYLVTAAVAWGVLTSRVDAVTAAQEQLDQRGSERLRQVEREISDKLHAIDKRTVRIEANVDQLLRR